MTAIGSFQKMLQIRIVLQTAHAIVGTIISHCLSGLLPGVQNSRRRIASPTSRNVSAHS